MKSCNTELNVLGYIQCLSALFVFGWTNLSTRPPDVSWLLKVLFWFFSSVKCRRAVKSMLSPGLYQKLHYDSAASCYDLNISLCGLVSLLLPRPSLFKGTRHLTLLNSTWIICSVSQRDWIPMDTLSLTKYSNLLKKKSPYCLCGIMTVLVMTRQSNLTRNSDFNSMILAKTYPPSPPGATFMCLSRVSQLLVATNLPYQLWKMNIFTQTYLLVCNLCFV